MPKPAVGTDFHKALDIECDLAAEVTLDAALELLGDDVAQLAHLSVVQLAGARVWIDGCKLQQSLGRGRPDPEDIGQRGLNALVPGNVDPSDTCHFCALPLTLLVLRVLTDHADGAMALDDLAPLADLFN